MLAQPSGERAVAAVADNHIPIQNHLCCVVHCPVYCCGVFWPVRAKQFHAAGLPIPGAATGYHRPCKTQKIGEFDN